MLDNEGETAGYEPIGEGAVLNTQRFSVDRNSEGDGLEAASSTPSFTAPPGSSAETVRSPGRDPSSGGPASHYESIRAMRGAAMPSPGNI